MESPNSLFNNLTNGGGGGKENGNTSSSTNADSDNLVIPSNFLISTRDHSPISAQQTSRSLLARAQARRGLVCQSERGPAHDHRPKGGNQSYRQEEGQRGRVRKQEYAPRGQAAPNDHSSEYNTIVRADGDGE